MLRFTGVVFFLSLNNKITYDNNNNNNNNNNNVNNK